MSVHKIFGPPGTGKTRYLLELFEKELKVVAPHRIAFLTFTRAARAEALDRSGRLESELPYLRTIHSICYRQLGVTQGQLIKPRDLRYFGKQLGVDLSGAQFDPWLVVNEEDDFTFSEPSRDDRLLNLNHLGRHRKLHLKDTIKDAPADIDFKYAKWFTLAYRDWKSKEGMLDYTDLLSEYIRVGKPLEVDVVFIDEAQDLSALQWDVIHLLSANAKRMYIAGDDDQTIFAWAGASAEMFQREYADKVEVLGKSYRVPSSVASLAQRVIHRVVNRIDKEWLARGAAGWVEQASYVNEYMLEKQSFVLCRNHYRGRQLASELKELAVPFLGIGSPLSIDDVSRALRAWAALSRGERITSRDAWSLISATPSEKLVPGSAAAAQKPAQEFLWSDLFLKQPKREAWAHTLTRLKGYDYLEAAQARRELSELLNPRVTLLSIHQSKGREAHTVILDTTIARKTYEAAATDDEHRVWYVGITRARERLFVLSPVDTMSYQL